MHAIKRTATRDLADSLQSAPCSPLIGQIMGRHTHSTNSRNIRYTYGGLRVAQRDLLAYRVPQALSLYADDLCTKVGWPAMLTPPMRHYLTALIHGTHAMPPPSALPASAAYDTPNMYTQV